MYMLWVTVLTGISFAHPGIELYASFFNDPGITQCVLLGKEKNELYWKHNQTKPLQYNKSSLCRIHFKQ